MNKQENEIKRWTAKRKTQVVLDILKGKTTVAEISRQHDLTPGEVERWVDDEMTPSRAAQVIVQ